MTQPSNLRLIIIELTGSPETIREAVATATALLRPAAAPVPHTREPVPLTLPADKPAALPAPQAAAPAAPAPTAPTLEPAPAEPVQARKTRGRGKGRAPKARAGKKAAGKTPRQPKNQSPQKPPNPDLICPVCAEVFKRRKTLAEHRLEAHGIPAANGAASNQTPEWQPASSEAAS